MPFAAKAAWEVRYGVIPGTPSGAIKQWFYTSADHDQDQKLLQAEAEAGLTVDRSDAPKTRFQSLKDEAVAYWNEQNDPRSNNWAELTFIWY